MATQQKGSASALWIGVIVGLAMAVGGYYLSVNWHPEFLAKLAEQGIPLDLGKTISSIGMFLVLFPVLKFFYFKPLGDAIQERTTDLERTFSEAEDLRNQMGQMRTDYERRLVETEAEARTAIQAQIKEAQTLRQTLMAEATAKADDMVRRANQEIEAEKNKVLSEIRLEVVNLTMAATTKLIGENMDSAKNRKLVTDFIDHVEVKA